MPSNTQTYFDSDKLLVKAWTYYKWTVYDLSFFDHDDRHRHQAVRIIR